MGMELKQILRNDVILQHIDVTLDALKYVDIGKPLRFFRTSLSFNRSSFFFNSWTSSFVRLSCHTIALYRGLPVLLSQATVVSL